MADTKFIKTKKEKNYTVLDNTFIKDVSLSWKAKGLMTYFISLPDDWVIHLSEIEKHANDGMGSLRSAINELKEHGYLKAEQKKVNGKFAEMIYTIIENPNSPLNEIPHTEKPHTENPHTEDPYTENRTQLNTNILNTKELNTNILNTDDDVVMRFYLNNINSTPVIKEIEMLESYQKELPDDLILYAMEKAVENKGRSLGYIKGILNSWKSKGITTLAEAKEERKPQAEKQDIQKYRSTDVIDYNRFYADI